MKKLIKICQSLYIDIEKLAVVMEKDNKWLLQFEGQVITIDKEDFPDLINFLQFNGYLYNGDQN